MPNLSLQDAYKAWRALQPSYNSEDCCHRIHAYFDNNGRCYYKPDHEVCDRERAWRWVVRIRDADYEWPFTTRYLKTTEV